MISSANAKSNYTNAGARPIRDAVHGRICSINASVSRRAPLSIASQITWAAQGFVTFLMAGRLLPKSEFGLVVVANTVLYGFQCILLGAVTNPTLRFGAVSRKASRVAYYTYAIITIVISLAFIAYGVIIRIATQRQLTFTCLAQFLCVPFATVGLFSVQKLILFARLRVATALAMDLSFAAANIVALVLMHQHGFLNSALSFYIARSGAALLGLLPPLLSYGLLRVPIVHEEDSQTFDSRHYLRHSTYSLFSTASSYGQGQVDVLAVAHFFDATAAASYGAAKVFYSGLTMVTSGLAMVIMPTSSRLAAHGRDQLPRYYRRAMLLAYSLLFPATLALVLFASPIVHLCFSGRYDGAAPLVRTFCIVSLFLPISSVTDAVANGAGRFRRAWAAATVGGIVGCAASAFLPRYLGLEGAALAPVAAIAANAIMIVILMRSTLTPSADHTAMTSVNGEALSPVQR